MSLLPLVIFAFTVSPATGQSPSPVNVTITTSVFFFLSFSLLGDTVIKSALHTPGVADGVGNGVDVAVPVGVAVGAGVIPAVTKAVSVKDLGNPVVLTSSISSLQCVTHTHSRLDAGKFQ